MAITKFASFQVISKVLVPENLSGRSLRRFAHRHNFQYEPRPGYLYVRSRAISSRCNDNYDEFPADEIIKSYASFVGKPVFVNHHNDDHRRARGVIIDAALHEDTLPSGAPDVWVEVLMEVDAVKFPKLAKAILAGHIDRTSMGTDVEFSKCSACGNIAKNPAQYCQHIPRMKGQRIFRATADGSGKREGVLIREICYGLRFFENSLLVEEPADPTAFFLGVDDRGLQMSASKTSVYSSDAKHPANHVLYGDGLNCSYCGAGANYHPHPSEGERTRCSLCGGDFKNDYLHDEGRYQHLLKGQYEMPADPTHLFETYGEDYNPSKESALEDDGVCADCHHASIRHFNAGDNVMRCGKCPCAVDVHQSRIMATKIAGLTPISDCKACGTKKGEHCEDGCSGVRLYRNTREASWSGDDPCSCGQPGHTNYQHADWAQERYAEGTHDAWGRPLMKPYDGHGAWSCNNFNCPEHPQEMYEHRPGQAPGWLVSENDPHKELTREVNKAFHDSGTQEDGRYLLDQQDQGPSKYSTKRVAALLPPDHGEHGPWNLHGQCLKCGYTPPTEADEPCDHEWCASNEPPHSKGEHIDPPHLDPGHSEYQSAERAINDAFGEDHGWLLDQNHQGPSKYSALDPESSPYMTNPELFDRSIQQHERDFNGAGAMPGTVPMFHGHEDAEDAMLHRSENSDLQVNPEYHVTRDQQLRDSETGRKTRPWIYHTDSKNVADLMNPAHMSSKTAIGETVAPKDVDTLRDEECPVCAEKDSYDGNECQVCGFVKPPSMFMDPDLDKAKQVDLRKDVAEGDDPLNQQGDQMTGDPNAVDDMGMPNEVPGSGQPGSDQVPLDPTQVGQDGEPLLDPNTGEPVDMQNPMAGGPTDIYGQPLGPEGPLDPDEVGNDGLPLGPDGQPIPQQGVMGDNVAPDGQPIDPEQSQDSVGELACPVCGETFQSAPPTSTTTDMPEGTPDGVVEGDACPSCGKGLLEQAGQGDGAMAGQDEVAEQGVAGDPGETAQDRQDVDDPDDPTPDVPGQPDTDDPTPEDGGDNPFGGGGDDDSGDDPYGDSDGGAEKEKDSKDSDDDQDSGSDDGNPVEDKESPAKKREASASVQPRRSRVEMPKEQQGSRPLMAAVASQQKVIEGLRARNEALVQGLMTIAHYAGLTEKIADILNPASPVADPAEEAPFESTQQAATPSAHDDVQNIGLVPGSTEHLPAESTTTALTPGADIPTQAFNQLVDVTAPVSGTPTHVPNEQTRIEVDVRVGDPDDPTKNFPLIPEFDNQPNTGASDPDKRAASRTFAAIKLARLRVAAGLETEDELAVAGRIEATASMSTAMIEHEIGILSQVQRVASRRVASEAKPNLVPRTAGVQRTVPSLAAGSEISATAASAGDDDADLFI